MCHPSDGIERQLAVKISDQKRGWQLIGKSSVNPRGLVKPADSLHRCVKYLAFPLMLLNAAVTPRCLWPFSSVLLPHAMT